MIAIKKFFILIASFLLVACLSSEPREQVKECFTNLGQFTSYQQAKDGLKSFPGIVQEGMGGFKDSWVKAASFYYCGGHFGFMIIEAKDGEYLFDNVPSALWKDFKNATSKEDFYHRYIRGKYPFSLASNTPLQ